MKLVYSILGTFNSGGMERVLTNKVNYLVAKGYDITIITTDQKGRHPYFHVDNRIKCIDLGINYTDDLSNGVIGKAFSYLNKQRQHFLALKKELEVIKADITISMFDNDASFLYKIKDGSKKVLEIHFSRFKRLQYARKGLLKLIDSYRSYQDLSIVRKYDRFVVLTNEDQGYWGDLENIEVIPNANSFETKALASLINKQVIAVGRLDYQKGFDDLVKVWDLVHRECPDWVLNIYGSGVLESELQQAIKKLKLEKVVFLQKPTKEIVNAYLDSSVLAMTSRYEGLPMTLLEAQVCGLPLVSYACKCGPRDIIQNNYNGFLVEEGDIVQMAQSLILLMKNQELRIMMGSNSKENSDNYNEEIIMKKWMSLFDRLIS